MLLVILISVLLASLGSVSDCKPRGPAHIHTLDSFANFESQRTNPDRVLLVYFHATWCQSCKMFMDPLGDVSRRLAKIKKLEGKHVIGTLDVTSNPEADHYARRLDLKAYPVMRMYGPHLPPDGEAYEGERDVDEIVAYVKKHVNLMNVRNHVVTPPPATDNDAAK